MRSEMLDEYNFYIDEGVPELAAAILVLANATKRSTFTDGDMIAHGIALGIKHGFGSSDSPPTISVSVSGELDCDRLP